MWYPSQGSYSDGTVTHYGPAPADDDDKMALQDTVVLGKAHHPSLRP